jgi:cell division protease FtsH
MSLGHTRQLPAEDRYLMTRSQFNDMLATLLAGHTAEKLIFDEMTTGAYDDIERATVIARKMVTDYGMSDKLGPRTFGHKEEPIFLGREIAEQRNYSEKVAEEIDDEVHQIIEHAYQVARKMLTKNKPKLIKIAEELIAKETLEGEDLEALLNKTVATPVRKARTEAAPRQEKAMAKAKPGIKKAPVIPLDILPKTAPATLD